MKYVKLEEILKEINIRIIALEKTSEMMRGWQGYNNSLLVKKEALEELKAYLEKVGNQNDE